MRSYRCQERLVMVRPISIGGAVEWDALAAWNWILGGRRRNGEFIIRIDRSESGGGGGVVYWRQIETAERRIARWKVRGAKGNEHLPSFLPPRCDRKTAWLLSPASQ